MATTTTRRRTYTVRISRKEIYKGRAIAWAVGLISYPVFELAIRGWMATH